MAGSNKSSLNNLDQSKADNLLTNLGENINSASNKLITGDFSNATNDLKTLQDDYEELLNAIRNNNLYDVLGEKIEIISNNLGELKNRTDQYLQSQEQSINKMLEALPQVVSKFRDIEERVRSVNNELGNQNGMQDFIAQVEDLKNKLNELIKLPLDDRSNVEQCAKEMAKIYVETIQSALETANIGKGLIVQAIKDDKVEIANELKRIVADTTMTINTMPNINPVETQNLNNTAMEVISVTVGAIDKLNNALEKAANIINNAEVNKSPQDDSDKLAKAITEANNDNIRRIYEVFKDLRPIDFESISYMSNEAQVGLNNQLLSTISSGSNNDVDNINNLMNSYAKINESSSHGKASQDNVKRLAQEFIDEFERGMDLDKLSEIWSEAKSELVNIIIESRRIAEQIANGNDIRNSLNENIPGIDNIHKGLGYYNSNILHEINGQDNLNIAANAASGTIIKYSNESQANKYDGLTDLTNETNNIFTQYAAITSDMINNLDEINEKIKNGGGSTPPPGNTPPLSGSDDFDGKPNLDADQHKRRYENAENFLKEMEKFDKSYGYSKTGVENALNQSEKIYRGFRTGRYSELDMLKANAEGHGEDYYKNLSEKLSDAYKLYGKKDNLKEELVSKINEYKNAYKEFEDDPTVEGLNDLNAKSDSIEQIIVELKNVLDQIAGNLNSKDVQDAIGGNAFDKKSQIGQESLKIQGDLVDSADNFNLASEVLQNSADMFDYKITSTAVKFGDKIVEAAGSAGSKFGTKLLNNVKSIFKKMVGMDLSPMALAGQFATGSRSYYQQFGQMDIDTMRAMLQQGDFYSQDVLDFNRNKTIELYGKYNGQIDFGEFSKMTNNLISNIQGHVGQDKISGQTDMLNLSEPAVLLNKVYGVDSENAINTFYKKIGMSAEETENHLYKLVQTAQSSNIPVSNYISTITTMSERFRELGVNINLANNGMQNLMLSGMSYEDSKDLVSGLGTAISNYDNNPGSAAFFGSMIGMDPFEAIYTTKARWEKDENGNYVVSESATKAIMDMIRKDAGFMSAAASGGGEYFQKSIVIDKFKSLGMDDKTAQMAMDKFFEDDLEGLREVLNDAENADKTVILEGREELEEKLSLVAGQTDALTTAQNQLNITNMELADVGGGIYELIGKSLTAIISTVGGILIKVVDLLEPVTNFLGGLLQKAVDNPITAILAAIATKLGIKGVASYLTGGKAGGLIGSAVSSAGSSAWTAIKAGSSKVPIIGGIVDAVVTAGDSYFGKGKTAGYSIGEGVGSGLGTAGFAAAGATIGSMILPGIGTAIGTGIGAWIGHKAGKKVAQVGMDAFDVQEYREGYGEDISAYDKLTDGSLSMNDQYYSSTGNYDNDYSQLFYERTGITPDYKELELDLDYDKLRLMEYDNTSKILSKLDEEMELQKGLSDKEYAALNSNIVNIKDVIAQNKTGQQLTSGQNNNALSIDTSLMFNLGKKEEGISTVHTSSSGASHGGAGRSFGEKEEGISTVHTSSSGILHGGSGRSFDISEEKGKDGNSLRESKKESIDEETLARQQKAAAEVASTNYYEKYKQIQASNSPLEEIEKESEKRREEQTQELISTISQKYSDLISSAQSEIDFLSIISDIDTNILTTLTEVKYILQNMKVIGSDDGKTTVHESSSGRTHGGAGKSFGDPDKEEGSYNNGYAKDTMTAATLKTETSAKGKIGSGMSAAEDKYDEQILLAAEAAKVDPNMVKALATQMTGMDNSKSGGMMGLDSVDLQAIIGNTSNEDLLKLGEMSEADALKALSNDPMLGALAGAEYIRLILNGSIGNQVGAMFGMKDGEVDNELTTQILMMMLKNDDYIYSNNAASLVGALKNGNIDNLNSYEKLYWNRAGEQYSDLTDIALGKNPLEDEMFPLKKSDFKSDNRGGYIRNGRTYTSAEVEQMILMSYGEIDENDFRSDNRGKFYLKGRSGEKDPRYTAAEVENIIKMSQNDDYSWLYSKGNIYNPDKETAESIAGVNGSGDNGSDSGSDSGGSSEATSGMAQWDEKYSGMMAAPIYVMGSAEYSNQTTQYDPSKFRGYDPMGIKLSSGQGLARNIVTNPSGYSTQMSLASSNKEVAEKVKERFSALSDKYYSTVNSYDDGSSNTRTGTITNKTDQQFTINISVGNADASAYTKAVQEAITKVTKEYYDTSDINSDITFGIMNSDY